MTTAEILRAAATRVRQGWCQGTMRNDGGGVCALGGMYDAMAAQQLHLKDILDAQDFLIVALHLTVPHRNAITIWNDTPGQTAENVAVGLEYGALLWEQQQAVNAVAQGAAYCKSSTRD